MHKKPALLTPVKVGRYQLRNRIVMAPLTRRRATDNHVPTDIIRTYYEQRASAGLIIAEATNISLQANGYMNSPGIYTKELNEYQLAYLHLLEPLVVLEPEEKYGKYLKIITPHFRKFYRGTLITNCGFDFNSGNTIIKNGHADLVAFGKLYISNPDLVERFATGAPLNPWDTNTFYYGGEKGYIDYPII